MLTALIDTDVYETLDKPFAYWHVGNDRRIGAFVFYQGQGHHRCMDQWCGALWCQPVDGGAATQAVMVQRWLARLILQNNAHEPKGISIQQPKQSVVD